MFSILKQDPLTDPAAVLSFSDMAGVIELC